MVTILQLPFKNSLHGAVAQQKILRLSFIYGLMFCFAQALMQATRASHLQAFAMGLIFPGAGFLALSNNLNAIGFMPIALAITAICLFVCSLILWFGTGNAVAPILVWVLSALVAAMLAKNGLQQMVTCGSLKINAQWLVNSLALLSFCFVLITHIYRQIVGKMARKQANLYLQKTAPNIAKSFEQASETASDEFSQEDLKRMRFLLDRALQPIENFDGFEWIDQFQTAAVRYQLNFLGYALSMAQATHCTAFGGYLDDAQRNLIIKQTDHRIWKYWRLENLWGNFRHNADPIARDNIMYTGFCATQIAMFHAASGSDYFLQKGSFSPANFAGLRYQYDFNLLIKKLDAELKRSDFYLMACEPNWVYPLCNTIGAAAIKSHDNKLWTQHETAFKQHLEDEFIDYVGRFIPCRSSYTGIAFPTIGGALPQALPCLFQNATMPDIALRQWLLLRRNLIENQQLNRKAFWPIDTGNYGFSRAAAYAGTALAAVELGDGELSLLCLAAFEQEYPSVELDGVIHRESASIWAHALEFFARCNVKNGFRTLIENPHKQRLHPIISLANYPDVLVAHASYQQGVLKAVFYHGAHASLQKIGFANLAPHVSYCCDGLQNKQFIADADGNATVEIYIDGRTEIHVYAIAESAN
jgi:Linalool dehydratase/isomerase